VTIKLKQNYLLTNKEDHLIFQVMELANNHVKIEFCTVPSRKGRKPTIVREFFWTTERSCASLLKDTVEISNSDVTKYLSEGL